MKRDAFFLISDEGGGCATELKSRHQQKACIASIRNIHGGGRGVKEDLQGTNKKKQPKNYIFGVVRRYRSKMGKIQIYPLLIDLGG